MKTYVAYLLSVLVWLAVASPAQSQAGRIEAHFTGLDTLYAGDVVQVSLHLDLSTAGVFLGAYQVGVGWDAQLLEYVGVQAGTLEQLTVNDSQVHQGEIAFSGFSTSGAGGDVILGVLDFRVTGQLGRQGRLFAHFVEAGTTAASDFQDLLPRIESTAFDFTVLAKVIDDTTPTSRDALEVLPSDID